LLAALLGDEELLMEHGLVASSNQNDKLNLAGLLNVLDGVIDCPGRIVVMTTNHPEKLDPALIRPGRVNKKIHLAWMPPHQIQLMLEYYFDTPLTTDQQTRVLALSETVTPAEVEEICAEYDDIEDAVAALETRIDPLA
jgi:chaperone BCS1